MYRKPSNVFLAEFLGISPEVFHKKVKQLIKKDFKRELEKLNIDNPDILLDEKGYMKLQHPEDPLKN